MRDYGGYGQIVEEARKLEQEQRDKTPTACPLCGTPLEENKARGLLNCPMGHYRIAGRLPDGK